ncbi:MAG: T9SS type A sorting domain-containing protein, partial [Bacteroidota bacterium]|nr:T9SS type A sorting domain-containing protein [Bacteroidota bacterium]
MRLILVFFLYFVFSTLQVFSQDTTCGIVWDEPILLSDTAFDAHSPKIALSGDEIVHIVWWSEKLSLRLPYARSTNSGQSFNRVIDLLSDSLSFPFPSAWNHVVANNSNVYVFFVGSTASKTPIRVVLSTDAGSTWKPVRDLSSDSTGLLNCVTLHRDTIAIVYAIGYRRILRSTDAGETWTKTSEDLDIFTKVALSSNMLHVVMHTVPTNYAEIEYRNSTDLGDTWNQKTIISTVDKYYSDIPSIAVDDRGDSSLILVAWRDTKYGHYGVFGASIISKTGTVKKDETSTSWMEEEILTVYPRGWEVETSVLNDMRAATWNDEFAADDTFHIVTRISKRHSSGWCSINDHTPDIQKALYPDIALSRKGVHIVWSQKVAERFVIFYQRGVFTTTEIKEEENNIPVGYSLSQNYPNPFNATTKIRFTTNESQLTTLKVYDVFGREVVTLVNEKKQPGEYEVEWIADGFASGVYFYRCTIYDSGFKLRTETKKAILM